MRLDFYGIIMNPFFLIFLTLFLGMWVGNWKKLGRMKFGVGGPLFVGLIIGWAIYAFAIGVSEGEEAYKAAKSLILANVIPSSIQSFVLMLFVTAIGLLASKDVGLVIRKYGLRFVVLGVVITLSGAVMSYSTVLIRLDSNTYEASGLYTGALTSSPGLGAAMEKAIKHAENLIGDYDNLKDNEKAKILQVFNSDRSLTPATTIAVADEQKKNFVHRAASGVGTGYAVSYPFGMIMVIVAMSLIPKVFKIDIEKEKEQYHQELEQMRKGVAVKDIKPVSFDLKSYALVCFAGYIIGMLEIYMGPLIGYFSLGSIGGILIASIIFGYIGRIGPFTFRMDIKILGVIRDISLASYVGMVGLTYGYQVVKALSGSGLYLVVFSIAIAAICILMGFFLGKYVFGINWIMLSGAICGGMTSTPGLGMAVDSIGSDDPAAGYAATYPFALVGMVLFTVIMYIMPF